MAEVKAAVAAAAKPVAKEAVATKTAAKPESKAAPKKAEAKKTTAKKTTTKTAEKKTTAKKAELKATVNVQFNGKSYTTEDLIKIAKDVWKYDLGKKVADLKSVELYVKPEESQAYYVINGEVTGSFGI